MHPEHGNRIRPGFVVVLGGLVAAVAILAWQIGAPASSRPTGAATPAENPDDASPEARPSEPVASKPQSPMRASAPTGQERLPEHAAFESQPPPGAPVSSAIATNAAAARKPAAAAVATLLASVPVTVERKTGTGEISGHVKTSDGQPLANVKVTAFLQDRSVYSRRGTKKKAPSLEERVAETIREHRQMEANKHEALTDGVGVYTMTGLADADYTIKAKADGYEIQPVSLLPYRTVCPNAKVDFLAKVLTRIPVKVYLPDGALAPRATLMLRKETAQPEAATGVAWTPDAPSIPVAPGVLMIRAQGGEEGELRSDERKVSFKQGDQPATLEFRLKPGTAIKGRIIRPADMRLTDSYYRVYVLKMGAGMPADAARLKQDGKDTTSTDDGRFRFDDLAAGTYLIGAGPWNGKVLVTETVTVVEGTTTIQDLVIPRQPEQDVLAVWVRGPDGQLVEEEDISFRLAQIRRNSSRSTSGFTPTQREDGAWLFWLAEYSDEGEDEDDVRYVVTATTAEYGEKKAEFTGTEREKTIQFGATATLKVTVAGYASSAYQGRLSLSLEKPQNPEDRFGMLFWREGEASISPEGVASLGPAETGNYEVVLAILIDKWNRRSIAKQAAQLQAGENRLTLEIPTLHTLKLSFEQPGATVWLNPEPATDGISMTIQQRAGKNRCVTLNDLLPGKYGIRAYVTIPGVETNLGKMTVSVPECADVIFRPDPAAE